MGISTPQARLRTLSVLVRIGGQIKKQSLDNNTLLNFLSRTVPRNPKVMTKQLQIGSEIKRKRRGCFVDEHPERSEKPLSYLWGLGPEGENANNKQIYTESVELLTTPG